MEFSFLEKIFINQFCAISPPWISKDVFYKLPFNFCDRWCEGIDLKSTKAMLLSISVGYLNEIQLIFDFCQQIWFNS